MPFSKISLAGLVNLEDWQKIQDSLSESFGITLKTIDIKGKLLTGITGPNRLCKAIPENSSFYKNFCGSLLISKINNNGLPIDEETGIKCPFDLDVFLIPVTASGERVVSYMVVGPVILNKRKEESFYAKYAKDAGLSPEELVDALIEINVFSYSKIRSVLKLIGNIFSYITQTGYHKKRLGEIAPEVIEIDPLFASYYEEKVLNALLNTCVNAFDADSGSVMIVDKGTKHLHIKSASRLAANIVNTSDVKVGESIAGIAAATAEPIILPKDKTRKGISKNMKRSYIKSSMIVPFSKANDPDVYGVINLNVLRKNRDFSEKDITFVKELINLASIALMPVK